MTIMITDIWTEFRLEMGMGFRLELWMVFRLETGNGDDNHNTQNDIRNYKKKKMRNKDTCCVFDDFTLAVCVRSEDSVANPLPQMAH